MYEDLESYLDLDDGAKDFEQLTNALGRLKLDCFFLLRKTRLNVLDEGLSGSLVKCRVVEERLLDEPDELALGDGCMALRLGKLEEQLQAGHLVILLEFKQD